MPLYLFPSQRRPAPEPLRTDDRKATLLGIAVWAVLLVVAMVNRDELLSTDRAWWIWTCVAGIVLGLAGLAYLHVREVRDRRDEGSAPPDES